MTEESVAGTKFVAVCDESQSDDESQAVMVAERANTQQETSTKSETAKKPIALQTNCLLACTPNYNIQDLKNSVDTIIVFFPKPTPVFLKCFRLWSCR
jgi:uncharacterized protein YqfB (UPF0267 family)